MDESDQNDISHEKIVFLGSTTSDPTVDSAVSHNLIIQNQYLNFRKNLGDFWMEDWSKFKGTLLSVAIFDGDTHRIFGSAVMVAPGVAIGARHVFEGQFTEFKNGRIEIYAHSIVDGSVLIWSTYAFALVDHTDLVILSLQLNSELPEDRTFNQSEMTGSLPYMGSIICIAGFTADFSEFPRAKSGVWELSGSVRVSRGEVVQVYPEKRDNAMLNWPCIELNCKAVGGMSGGPAYDDKGKLIGIVCSSMASEDGLESSFVSLLKPSFSTLFGGGWPRHGVMGKPQTLTSIAGGIITLDV